MNSGERRATVSLAMIFSLRMMGLFMVLPVFTLYAGDYDQYSPTLAGLAIGIYGLTQALFQIPFGLLSDRFGRKTMIIIGLLIFAAGSVFAALAHDIAWVIVGRALQGVGAISAVVIALAADLTRDNQRTKTMATIGMSIGVSFALSLIAGPLIAGVGGLASVFWVTAVLALSGIPVLIYIVPSPRQSPFHRDAQTLPSQLGRVLRDGQLLRLDVGIGLLHMVMTATFIALPLMLRDVAGIPADQHWLVYLFVLVCSMAAMVPAIIHADRHNRVKHVFLLAIVALGLSQWALQAYHSHLYWLLALLVVYMSAFNILEASLPSMVSRLAPADLKGTALGVYSTCQHFGAFCGGLLGGLVVAHIGVPAVFGACALLSLAWLLWAASMHNPPALSPYLLQLGTLDPGDVESLTRRLLAIEGVAEAVIVIDERKAYLKVEKKRLNAAALRAISVTNA